MKIGIGITTRNRNQVCFNSIDRLINIMGGEVFELAIVDDASTIPYEYSHFRFANNAGVSEAKNKCLDLLYNVGCTHFFLFDDDCYPIVPDWYAHYINSGLNHACWTFDRELIYSNGYYNQFAKPNGCMLYFKKICLNTVGGWDTSFCGYGYEHCNLSDRIFNAGLTPGRYVDVKQSGLFELAKCESSFTSRDREQIPANLKLYQDNFYSKEFKEFRSL